MQALVFEGKFQENKDWKLNFFDRFHQACPALRAPKSARA
jgi:hypothetical protein